MQENTRKKTAYRPHLLLLYWLAIMALLLLLVTATYTWFYISRTPRVNSMDLSVTSQVGLEISLRPGSDGDWGQTVRFDGMVTQSTPLKPCTWSDSEGRFYAAVYGADGRATGEWTPLSDAENANTEGEQGFYTMGTVYARSDTAVKVSLGEAVTLEDGTRSSGTYLIGTPVWDGEAVSHYDGGSGAEYAVRIGIRVTPVSETGAAAGSPVFYIYEPNSDRHISGAGGYAETPSIDGEPTLVPENRLITQTSSYWTEVSPVQQNVTFRSMGRFTSDTYLFSLEAGQTARLDLYIWLEGQDADCTYEIGEEARVFASLQLTADYGSQSGLVPVG